MFSNSILKHEYYGRFEAEFYLKLYNTLYNKITSLNFNLISKLVYLTDGEHGNAQTFSTGYAKYYGARNVLSGILDNNNVEFITKEHHNKIKKSRLCTNDILISCVGANIGYAAIVPDEIGEANIVRNVALMRSNSPNLINHYLLAYFLSKYGKILFIRMATGNAQPLVSLEYIKTIPVYLPNLVFQEKIKLIVEKAKKSLLKFQTLYIQAEDLLLQAIGLQNFVPSKEAVNIKSFKDSFLNTGRLDAEYYQRKYEEVIQLIKQQNYDILNNIVTIEKSIEPGSKAYQNVGIPFIRVSNLTKYGLSTPDIHLDVDKYKDIIMPKKDTILLSKDGTVGLAYKVEKDLNCITSGAILHLNLKVANVLPDYLALVLNSKVTQLQAERDAGGSIIQHWKSSEIAQVLIPIVNIELQTKIAELIQESFKLKAESEDLLQLAKEAVEIAIEQSEDIALAKLATYDI